MKIFNPNIYNIFVISFLLLITSCVRENNLIEQKSRADILTTDKWECVKIYDKFTNDLINSCLSDDKFDFKEDGECTYYTGGLSCYYNQQAEIPSTWALENNDNSLRIVLDDSLLYEYDIFKIDESVLILESEINGITALSKFEPF